MTEILHRLTASTRRLLSLLAFEGGGVQTSLHSSRFGMDVFPTSPGLVLSSRCSLRVDECAALHQRLTAHNAVIRASILGRREEEPLVHLRPAPATSTRTRNPCMRGFTRVARQDVNKHVAFKNTQGSRYLPPPRCSRALRSAW